MADNIQSSAKQGLGAALIVDGQQFPAAWVPEAVNFERETIDVTHAQTKNFRASKVAELSEPLEITGTFFFDPSLQELVELMTSEGVNQEREIYFIFPKTSAAAGTTEENGYIYMPKGTLGIGTINTPLDDAMSANFTVSGGISSPEVEAQKVVAGNVPVSVDDSNTSNLTGTAEDDVVVTLDSTGVTHGPTIYFELGGTDAAEFYLEGKFVKAAAGVTTGAKSLTVSAAGYRAWAEDDTADHLTGATIDFTLS